MAFRAFFNEAEPDLVDVDEMASTSETGTNDSHRRSEHVKTVVKLCIICTCYATRKMAESSSPSI